MLQRRTYEAGDYLRKALMTAGAVIAVTDDAAFTGDGPGILVPKQAFVDLEGAEVSVALDQPGKALAQQQLQGTYLAVAKHARAWQSEEPLEGAAQAIAELRERQIEPDAVLLPRDPQLRGLFGRENHPGWKWNSDFLQQSPQLATLSGVPVYDPGPKDATSIVICRLEASVRKLERRPSGSHAVRADVQPIDKVRAQTLFDAGQRVPGVPDDPDAQLAAMRDGYVEVHVEMDVEWQRRAECSSAWRIELSPVHERRRKR